MKGTSRGLLNVAVAVIFATTVVTAASAPVLAKQSAKPLPTLRWYGMAGLGQGANWVNTLDGVQVTDSFSNNVMNMVDSNLVKLLPNGDPAPYLAQKITQSKNHRTYTFLLRKNLRFANGDPLTAQVIDYSITRAELPVNNSPVVAIYDGFIAGSDAVMSGKTKKLSGIKVVNSRELKITLTKAIPFFLKTLTYPTADIVDPRVMKHEPKPSASNPPGTYLTNTCSANVGDAPFRFQCRNKDSNPNHDSFFAPSHTPSMTLVPNKYYFGAKPKIKVVIPLIPTIDENYSSFLAGQVDMTQIPAADVPGEVHSHHGQTLLKFATSAVDYMTPNEHKDSLFRNKSCRLAVAYAVNRNAINKGILYGTQTSTYQILPKNIAGYNSKFIKNSSWAPHYDVKKAKAEIKHCPAARSANITIPFQSGVPDIASEYSGVANMMKKVGFKNVNLAPINFNYWLEIVGDPKGLDADKTNRPDYPQKVDLVENLWIEDFPDAEDYMTNLLTPTANYDIGYYNNKSYTQKVTQAEYSFNQSKRNQLYQQAERIALNDGAWIAIGNQVYYALVNPKVHGLVKSAAYGLLVPNNDDWSQVTIK